MKIELQQHTVGEIIDGFTNDAEEGVVGFGGKLNIRPKYQREFVYSDKQRNAVMDTIWKGFPLNVMYWVRNADGTYELLDGQQRTISFCSFVAGEFMMNFDNNLRGFENLTPEMKQRILDYTLQIYVCEGTPDEQLDWFRIINIAGEKLTDQELLNAVYSGAWVTAAKRRFSKTGCVAFKLGSEYLDGAPIRQAYLETAIHWISNGHIEAYMATHQRDADADELWQYFQTVIAWVKMLFPKYYREMKGVAWGLLYNAYKDKQFKASELEKRVAELMEDIDVTKKKGIFTYVITNDERELSIRAFDKRMVREAYQRQNGTCVLCGEHFDIEGMEADHITPWSQGGKTIAENCQMLCRACNRRKSDR